jgi:hypothetical protein
MATLDHYNGRAVEDVNDEDGEWQIVLEGDVRIINFADDYEMPDAEMMKALTFQGVGEMSVGSTTLRFGTNDHPNSTVMNLSPTEYGIADPERFEGVLRPQAEGQVEPEPVPEEDAERLQEGPEEAEEGEAPPEGEEAADDE